VRAVAGWVSGVLDNCGGRLPVESVIIRKVPVKINFCPSNYEPAGVVSFVPWSNRELQEAFRRAFNESPREQIVELVIERAGVKAVFETRAACRS
jgi:hypothetical protein